MKDSKIKLFEMMEKLNPDISLNKKINEFYDDDAVADMDDDSYDDMIRSRQDLEKVTNSKIKSSPIPAELNSFDDQEENDEYDDMPGEEDDEEMDDEEEMDDDVSTGMKLEMVTNDDVIASENINFGAMAGGNPSDEKHERMINESKNRLFKNLAHIKNK